VDFDVPARFGECNRSRQTGRTGASDANRAAILHHRGMLSRCVGREFR